MSGDRSELAIVEGWETLDNQQLIKDVVMKVGGGGSFVWTFFLNRIMIFF
jgi:hypothetical protein